MPEMSSGNVCTNQGIISQGVHGSESVHYGCTLPLRSIITKAYSFSRSGFVPDILSKVTWLTEMWILGGSGLITHFLITTSSAIFHHLKLHSMKNEG